MKKKVLILGFCVIAMVIFIQMQRDAKQGVLQEDNKANSDTIIDSENHNEAVEESESLYAKEGDMDDKVSKESEEEDMANTQNKDIKIQLKVEDEILSVTWEDNSSTRGLLEKLQEGPVSIKMRDYGSMEKVGGLGFSLPKNDTHINAKSGDIILYQGNALVIYYDKNSWNFTKMGTVDGLSQSELKTLLGKGDVTVTLELINE